MSQTGSFCVVGLGSGTSALITGQAHAALQGADVVIGYDAYFTWVAAPVRDKECISQHRAPAAPVGLVRNAYRPHQAVMLTTVSELVQAPIDMLTTVIVRNSQTRCFQSRLITPRGYLC